MSISTISATTIPGIPVSCAVQIPTTSPKFPGLIALGPTLPERDILYACCHTLHTDRFSVNDMACLQTATCKVDECTLRDPSYACVSLQRESWKVNGTFACLAGSKESKGRQVQSSMMMWVGIALMVGVAGFGAM